MTAKAASTSELSRAIAVRTGFALFTLCLALGWLLSASARAETAAAKAVSEPWVSEHYRDHPLVGTIWNGNGEQVSRADLDAAVVNARFALLGEIHDNPDHHRMQADLLAKIAKSGRQPTVVFEMVTTDFQDALDTHTASGATTTEGLETALNWKKSGWPAWGLYEPIFAEALKASSPLRAGGIPRKELFSLLNLDVFEAYLKNSNVSTELPKAAMGALEELIAESHCNLMPRKSIASMTRAQRARDVQMVKPMLESDPTQGAVLIAGNGHVRKDLGVAALLAQTKPETAEQGKTVAVRMTAVLPDKKSYADYADTVDGLAAPFDFTVFTPKSNITDYCAKMREHMEKKKYGKKG